MKDYYIIFSIQISFILLSYIFLMLGHYGHRIHFIDGLEAVICL